jgi:uncharacterized protein YdhG (YjbR/CyaY superfamily)
MPARRFTGHSFTGHSGQHGFRGKEAGDVANVDQAVRDYIDAVAPEHRELFDRLHRLILAAHPDVAVVLSYKIPTYKAGRRRLYLGAWQHGVSLYGWPQERGAEFSARHPELRTSKGTLRLRPQDAAGIPDEELLDLVGAALDP